MKKLKTLKESAEANSSLMAMIRELAQMLEQKKPESVLEKLRSLGLDSNEEISVDLLNIKAIALRNNGQLDESLKAFQMCLQKQPDNAALLINYANLLVVMGRRDEAVRILSEVVKKNPRNSEAAKNLSILRRQDERKSSREAPADSRMSQTLDPLSMAFDDQEIEENKRVRRERDEKIRQKKRLKKPSFPKLDQLVLAEEWLLAAGDAMRAGNSDLALRLCTRAHKAGAESYQCYGVAGDIYIELRQLTAAHLCYMLAQELGGLDLHQKANLISLTVAIGDHRLAERRSIFAQSLPPESKVRKGAERIMRDLDISSTGVCFMPDGLAVHPSKRKKAS